MNCIVVDDEEVSRTAVRNFINKANAIGANLYLIAECDSAASAAEILKTGGIDIVFLDIDMPVMNGLELIDSLESLPQIILTTSRNDYAITAFDYGLTDYLVKPIEYKRFLQAVNKAKANLSEAVLDTQGSEDIYVKADNKIIRVVLSDVHFVEALADYVIIHTEGKKHIVHSTMKGIERRLPETEFIRVHRSYIVNISRVEAIEDNGATIVMGKKMIPIGGSYRTKFLDRLNLL